MSSPCIFVADVGKTNKKAQLYDANLQVLESEKKSFPVLQREGFEWDDTEALLQWLMEVMAKWSCQHEIGYVSFSCHGATVALIDDEGRECLPPCSYLSDVPQADLDAFADRYGSGREIHRQTQSPDIGFINLARQFFVLKRHFPEEVSRAKVWMPLNSYLAWKMSGVMSYECTYLGNHSALWDHAKADWNGIAQDLGVSKLAPERVDCHKVLGTLKACLKDEYQVSSQPVILAGIHDSNAALCPTLANERDLLLLSTGTWCLAMGRSSSLSLSEAELDLGTYHNISCQGEFIKTASFTGGDEYSVWLKALERATGMKDAVVGPTVLQRVVSEQRCFLYPGASGGATLYPNIDPGILFDGHFVAFADEQGMEKLMASHAEDVAAALQLSMSLQCYEALCGLSEVKDVVMEGGFINNTDVLGLLSQLLGDRRLETSDLPEASAYGAANLALSQLQGCEPLETTALQNIKLSEVTAFTLRGLDLYKTKFHQHRPSLEVRS